MNWKRSLIGIGVALPIVALLAYGLTRDPNAMDTAIGGRAAPDFALAMMDGEPRDTVRLEDMRGEIVVVNFWASWCLECRVEHADLSRAAAEYGAKGVRFFGILYADTPENGRRWIMEQGGQPYPALLDERKRTAISYGLYGVPETVIIGRDGTVVHKKVGPFRSYAEIAQLLDPLVAGQTVAEAES